MTAVLLSLLVIAQPGPARTADAETAEADERLTFMKDSARVYEFSRDDGRAKLPLRDEPLLRWNNPVSDVKDGLLVLWTEPAGRPVAAAQVFLAAGSDTLWLHEFQSLADEGFTVERDNRTVWAPESAGVQMRPVPDAPPPAETPVGRLVQMRAIAKEFQASDDFEGKSRWELRLMPQPLHRYGAKDGTVRDGALFVFAHGTDPEVFLLLEARTEDGKTTWHYGLAPMTSYAVTASLRDEEVWSADTRPAPHEQDSPFFILVYKP